MIRALGLALLVIGCSGPAPVQHQWPLPGVASQWPPQPDVGEPHIGKVLPGLYIRRFNPPEEYERWYHAMEKCVGARGDYRKVEWLVVAAPWLDGQRRTHGSWESKNGRERITVNAQEWLDSTLVMHEAIHDILWRAGWRRPPLADSATDTDSILAQHPTPPFERCATTFYTDQP